MHEHQMATDGWSGERETVQEGEKEMEGEGVNFLKQEHEGYCWL